MAGLRPPVADIGVAPHRLGAYLALLAPFALLCLIFALLDRLGLQAESVPQAVTASALGLFLLAALFSPGRRPADYYAADRDVAPSLGGLAAAGGLAGLLTIRFVAGLDATSAEFVASACAVAIGAALLSTLIAPGLRRSAGYTAGDFFAARFGVSARLIGALVMLTASFLLLLAFLKTFAPMLASLVGISPEHAVYAAAGLALLAVLPGGMRSLSTVQLLQYVIILLAGLVPAAFLVVSGAGPEGTDEPALQVSFRQLMEPFSGAPQREAMLPLLMLAAGVGCFPPLFVHVLAAPSPREAGATIGRAVLYFLAFVACALVLGQTVISAAGLDQLGALAGDLVQQAILVQALPSVIEGLLMAGLLAALLALGQGVLFATAAALSHDLWDEVVDRRGPAGRRLLVARGAAIAVAAAAAWTVGKTSMDESILLDWALSFAAGGTLAPLLLGIWWKRCTALGAALGMASGYIVVLAGFLRVLRWPSEWAAVRPHVDVSPADAALLGIVIAVTVAVSVSLLVRPAEKRRPPTKHAASSLPGRERPA